MAAPDRSPARRPDPGTARGTGALLSRAPLREHVKDVLLERILTHVYAPGERLVETRIAQELGVSQAPVREALRELESLRFVESAPFRGSWVREVSDAELAEVYPIRAALEEVAAHAAAGRMGGDVRALEREVARMAKARGVREQVEHDVAFHRLIVEASGNGRLGEIWSSLQVEARTTITTLRTGLDPREVAALHEPIVEALRREDAKAAGREARRHVEEFGRRFAERAAAEAPGAAR